MDAHRNPFSPGAGAPPPELAGRQDILDRAALILARVRARRSEKSLLLIGLRGVGKTVLLRRIADLAQADGYKAVMIEAEETKRLDLLLVPYLRQILFDLDRLQGISEKVKRGLRVFKSFLDGLKLRIGDMFELSVDVDPERGTADSGDLQADLSELFVAIAEAAADRQTAVALVMDELQYLSEDGLNALIMAIHQVTQRQLPLVLIGAGLPQLIGNAGRAKSYAERLFDFPEVGALTDADARDALWEPVRAEGVRFTRGALDEIVRTTQGYPYFLQEWGYQSWNVAPASPINLTAARAATEASIARLDSGFFRVRFDRLTPSEKRYLRAMAEIGPGPHRSGDIARKLGVAVQTVAPIRSALTVKGMVYSPAHGDTAFTVPLFDEFMKRTIPQWLEERYRKK